MTPVLPTEEPMYSLSMGYEHIRTIPEMKSGEVIESSVKNLLPIPSEYKVTFDDESERDVPVKNESSPDVPMKDFKVYSNPLFDDEEISSDDIESYYFNDESDFVESLPNCDTFFDSFLKFDYLEEVSGALMPIRIINEERIRREYEEYISLMEKLLAINSFSRSLENFHANMIGKTLPTSPIPIEDSDSQREEIDIFTGTDDLLPPGEVILAVINNIDELNEDEYFDPRGKINVFANVEDDDYFPFVFVIQNFLPYLIYHEVSPLLLSAGSEDTIFDPGISV
uniref:Reverse transcriptase domain-containing protein n=1 Tax=Tanacetum cinerariifolium TaxID=118510 RepID=A0A6L2K320_TANCI|nr:hypothetical protein [Tanacetum cinerariifolium]